MTPLDKPARSVTRLTLGTLGGCHGKDKHRRLAVTLGYGDTVTIRPHGTRRSETVAIIDIYSWAIRCRANKLTMERLRERKAKKAERAQAARSRRIIRGGLTP